MMALLYPASPAPIIPAPTADNPNVLPAPGEEMLPIIEENGVVIGQAARKYCHSGAKPLHPVVHLHIINRFEQIYLQKRAMHKDLLPGYWDTAVGGHVGYGEYIGEAILREAAEELGFTQFNPIPLRSYVWESVMEKELVNVFAAVGNFEPHPDHDEVEEGRYWSIGEIEQNIGKNIFTPNFESEFRKIKDSLCALL